MTAECSLQTITFAPRWGTSTGDPVKKSGTGNGSTKVGLTSRALG